MALKRPSYSPFQVNGDPLDVGQPRPSISRNSFAVNGVTALPAPFELGKCYSPLNPTALHRSYQIFCSYSDIPEAWRASLQNRTSYNAAEPLGPTTVQENPGATTTRFEAPVLSTTEPSSAQRSLGVTILVAVAVALAIVLVGGLVLILWARWSIRRNRRRGSMGVHRRFEDEMDNEML